MTPTRHGNRWTVNELIALQRECELLEMSVTEIAEKHQRTKESILFRIEQEGFMMMNQLNNGKKKDELTNRVNNLESSVSQMKGMVKQVVSHFMETRRKKQQRMLKPLRKAQTASYL
jgi:predicted site-specific integrase-resolvase